MSQLRSQPSSLLRKSLREWQASYKVRQALLLDDEPAAQPTAGNPPRQKRLVARRKRPQRQQA